MNFKSYPLGTRVSRLRTMSSVCDAQGTPRGFWNGVDWRAQRLISSIGKAKRIAFFFFAKTKYFQKIKTFWILFLFLFFFAGLGWTGELWSNCAFLWLRDKEDFFYLFRFLLKIKFFKYFRFCEKTKKLLFEIFLDFGFFDNLWLFIIIFFDNFFQHFRFFGGIFRILFEVTKVTTKFYRGY